MRAHFGLRGSAGDHQRELDYKGRAPSFALALRLHCSAVKLHQVPDYREPQTQPALPSRAGAVGLAKAIKDKRKELGAYAFAGVADGDFDMRADALKPDLRASVLRRELYGV